MEITERSNKKRFVLIRQSICIITIEFLLNNVVFNSRTILLLEHYAVRNLLIDLIIITIVFLVSRTKPFSWTFNKYSAMNKNYGRTEKSFFFTIIASILYLILHFLIWKYSFNFNIIISYISSLNLRMLILYLICTFISALSEELMFKGMLYRGLKEETNLKFIIIAIMISVLFLLWHTGYYGRVGMITTFTFQLISIIIYQYYPSLWLTTGMHFVTNVIITLIAETQ